MFSSLNPSLPSIPPSLLPFPLLTLAPVRSRSLPRSLPPSRSPSAGLPAPQHAHPPSIPPPHPSLASLHPAHPRPRCLSLPPSVPPSRPLSLCSIVSTRHPSWNNMPSRSLDLSFYALPYLTSPIVLSSIALRPGEHPYLSPSLAHTPVARC